VCRAIQQLFDLLSKDVTAGSPIVAGRVFTETLPPKILELALACGWLPPAAGANKSPWLEWVKKLIEDRYDRQTWERSDDDPFYFLPFPRVAKIDRRRRKTETFEDDKHRYHVEVLEKILQEVKPISWYREMQIKPTDFYNYKSGRIQGHMSSKKRQTIET